MVRINLLKSKIEELEYVNQESINELEKLLRIAKLVIKRDSEWLSPPLPAYALSVSELVTIEETESVLTYKIKFDDIKEKILYVIDNLISNLKKFEVERGVSIGGLFGNSNILWERIELALLIVEQNHLDFFKSRESHSPIRPHDQLSSHYIIHSHDGKIEMNFHDDELPKYIITEALDAFTSAVGQKKNLHL